MQNRELTQIERIYFFTKQHFVKNRKFCDILKNISSDSLLSTVWRLAIMQNYIGPYLVSLRTSLTRTHLAAHAGIRARGSRRAGCSTFDARRASGPEVLKGLADRRSSKG